MTTMTYPSPLVPAPPRVAIDVPDGWEQVPVAQTLLAVREVPGPDTDFAANVVVRQFQRPAEVTETVVLDELAAWAREQPHGRMEDPFELTLGDQTYAAAYVSFDDPAGEQVQLAQLLAGEVRGPLVTVVQTTASFAGPADGPRGRAAREVVTTLRLDRGE